MNKATDSAGEQPSDRARFFQLVPDYHRQRDRLTAELDALRIELDNYVASKNKDAPWVSSAGKFHALALSALKRGDLQSGWRHTHDMQQLLMEGWEDGRLIAHALALRAEADQKIDGWRKKQVAALFNPSKIREILDFQDNKKKNESSQGADASHWPGLVESQVQQLRTAVIEAQRTLNGEHSNNYHRIALVKSQLTWLIGALVVVLVGFVLYFGLTRPTLTAETKDTPLIQILPGVGLFGALGGILSAAYQLSRAGKRKIPESVLTGVVTLGRPLVGAGAAVFIYIALSSAGIKGVDPGQLTFAAAFTFAFIAGFSERLVIDTAKG
jgi:hypothetical protein